MSVTLPTLPQNAQISVKLSELPPDFNLNNLSLELNNHGVTFSEFSKFINNNNPSLPRTEMDFLRSVSADSLRKYLEYNSELDQDPQIILPAKAAKVPVIADILKKQEAVAVAAKEQNQGILASAAATVSGLFIGTAYAASEKTDADAIKEAAAREHAVIETPAPLNVFEQAKLAAAKDAIADLPLTQSNPAFDDQLKEALKHLPSAEVTPIQPAIPRKGAVVPISPAAPGEGNVVPLAATDLPPRLQAPEPTDDLVKLSATSSAALVASPAPAPQADPELDKLIADVSGKHTTLSVSKHYKEENKLLQKALIELGYMEPTDAKGRPTADGYFGEGTDNAVKAFKADNSLKDDGKVGNLETWPALLNKLTEKRDGGKHEASLGEIESQRFASTSLPERGSAIT